MVVTVPAAGAVEAAAALRTASAVELGAPLAAKAVLEAVPDSELSSVFFVWVLCRVRLYIRIGQIQRMA